jgi:tetratricopeptide (TPR) repeat protein
LLLPYPRYQFFGRNYQAGCPATPDFTGMGQKTSNIEPKLVEEDRRLACVAHASDRGRACARTLIHARLKVLGNIVTSPKDWTRVRLPAVAAIVFVALWAFLAHAQADDLNRASSLERQVVDLANRFRFAEAIPIAREVVAIREKELGVDHPFVSGSLSNLALLYVNQGRYAEAEPLYKRALEINEKALGPDSSSTASALNN